MLINPDRMKLVYKGVRFEVFELERECDRMLDSRIRFFSPVCARCLFMHGMINEDKQHIEHRKELSIGCGVEDCDNQADFLVSFDFGFEEGDVEEEKEEGYSGWEDLYEHAELKFD